MDSDAMRINNRDKSNQKRTQCVDFHVRSPKFDNVFHYKKGTEAEAKKFLGKLNQWVLDAYENNMTVL